MLLRRFELFFKQDAIFIIFTVKGTHFFLLNYRFLFLNKFQLKKNVWYYFYIGPSSLKNETRDAFGTYVSKYEFFFKICWIKQLFTVVIVYCCLLRVYETSHCTMEIDAFLVFHDSTQLQALRFDLWKRTARRSTHSALKKQRRSIQALLQ